MILGVFLRGVSLNSNSFSVRCSVIASAALTRERVLHFLSGKVKFYLLIFRTFFNAINCYIILKSVFLPNTWAGQQYQYLKDGGDNPIANKKNDAGAGCDKFHGASCHNVADCQYELSLEWLARILVSVLSLACYHISVQTNIVTRFWRFFSSRIQTLSLSRISPVLYQSRDFTYERWTVSKHLLSLLSLAHTFLWMTNVASSFSPTWPHLSKTFETTSALPLCCSAALPLCPLHDALHSLPLFHSVSREVSRHRSSLPSACHAYHYWNYCLHLCAICFKWTKYNTIVVFTMHHRKLCTCMFILKANVWFFCNIFDR